jgi:hypothetical protein
MPRPGMWSRTAGQFGDPVRDRACSLARGAGILGPGAVERGGDAGVPCAGGRRHRPRPGRCRSCASSVSWPVSSSRCRGGREADRSRRQPAGDGRGDRAWCRRPPRMRRPTGTQRDRPSSVAWRAPRTVRSARHLRIEQPSEKSRPDRSRPDEPRDRGRLFISRKTVGVHVGNILSVGRVGTRGSRRGRDPPRADGSFLAGRPQPSRAQPCAPVRGTQNETRRRSRVSNERSSVRWLRPTIGAG